MGLIIVGLFIIAGGGSLKGYPFHLFFSHSFDRVLIRESKAFG